MNPPREHNRSRRLSQEVRSQTAARPARPTPAGTPSAGPQIDPKMILMAFRDSWKWALPTGILLAGAAAAAIFQWWRPQYEAKAMIQIQHKRSVYCVRSDGDWRTWIRAIRADASRASAKRVGAGTGRDRSGDRPRCRRSRSGSTRVGWLSGALAINGIGKSELYQVRFKSYSPRNAATIVNAVVDEYLRTNRTGSGFAEQPRNRTAGRGEDATQETSYDPARRASSARGSGDAAG